VVNNDYYLYTGNPHLTMSPYSGPSALTVGMMWRVTSDGLLSSKDVKSTDNSIRPVINLQSTVELSNELPNGCTKLDGTAACPYIIKTN